MPHFIRKGSTQKWAKQSLALGAPVSLGMKNEKLKASVHDVRQALDRDCPVASFLPINLQNQGQHTFSFERENNLFSFGLSLKEFSLLFLKENEQKVRTCRSSGIFRILTDPPWDPEENNRIGAYLLEIITQRNEKSDSEERTTAQLQGESSSACNRIITTLEGDY